MDVAGKRSLWEVHVGIRRVVFRSRTLGDLFVGEAAVLWLFQRRGKHTPFD